MSQTEMNIDGTTYIVSNATNQDNGQIVVKVLTESADDGVIHQGHVVPIRVVSNANNMNEAASQFIDGTVVTMTTGVSSASDVCLDSVGNGTAILLEADRKSLDSIEDEAAGRSPGVAWPRNAVLKLISFHLEHQSLFDNSQYKKRSIWEMISRKLKENGMRYSWSQAENKWKSLTKRYRDTLDYNAKNSEDIILHTCPFHEELALAYPYTVASTTNITNFASFSGNQHTTATVLPSPILGKRPLAEVVGSLSESDLFPLRKKKYQHCATSSSTQIAPKPTVVLPSCHGDTQSTELGALLRVIHEDRKLQDKVKMDRLETMHREKMELFQQFLQVIKDVKHE